MSKFIEETQITQFVKLLGDDLLVNVVSSVYSNKVFLLVAGLFFLFNVLKASKGINDRQIPIQPIVQLGVVLLLWLPVNGKPFGYLTVNTFITGLISSVESGVLSGIKKKDSSNLPSGAALQMIIAAATSPVKDPLAKKAIAVVGTECLPNALTQAGNNAKFQDLFNYSVSYSTGVDGSVIPVFTENILSAKSLENQDINIPGLSSRDCYSALNSARLLLKPSHHASDYLVVNQSLNSGGGTGESKKKSLTLEEWATAWQRTDPEFLKIAMNINAAVSAQYAASEVINENSGVMTSWGNSYHESIGTSASIREAMIALGSNTADLGFEFSDMGNMLANVTGTRYAMSVGGSFKDLKERLENLPFVIAIAQNLLKILFPIMILTLFLGTYRFFTLWVTSWGAAACAPAIVNIMRANNNSILFTKLGLDNVADGNSYATLAHGVNLEAVNELSKDFVMLANSMISTEIQAVSIVSGSIALVGGLLSVGGGHKQIGSFANHVMNSMIMSGLHSLIRTGNQNNNKQNNSVANTEQSTGQSQSVNASHTVSQASGVTPSNKLLPQGQSSTVQSQKYFATQAKVLQLEAPKEDSK